MLVIGRVGKIRLYVQPIQAANKTYVKKQLLKKRTLFLSQGIIIVSNFYLLIQHLCVCVPVVQCAILFKHWDTEMIKHGFGEEPNVGSFGKGVWMGQSWPIHLGSGMSCARFSVLTYKV